MKEFWNDYVALWNESGKFYKKHWKGCLVVTAAVVAAETAYFVIQNKKIRKSIEVSKQEAEVQ